MNEMKRLASFVRRAVDDYNLIDDGDRIAVGVSGGKDSLVLLETLAHMRRFYPKKYELVAITQGETAVRRMMTEVAGIRERGQI